MSVTLPEGETDIQFSFERPDIVVTLWLSLAAWFGCLLFFVVRYYNKTKIPPNSSKTHN